MQYYEEQFPEDVRQADLVALMESFERIDTDLAVEGGETPKSGSAADD